MHTIPSLVLYVLRLCPCILKHRRYVRTHILVPYSSVILVFLRPYWPDYCLYRSVRSVDCLHLFEAMLLVTQKVPTETNRCHSWNEMPLVDQGIVLGDQRVIKKRQIA